jgi:ABC-type methionine transport system ATPase subunit
MAKRRVYLTYTEETVKEPLIYHMGHQFNVVTNIRTASISKDIALVALQLEGKEEEIDKALSWMESQKVRVEPIEKNVIE